MTTRRACAPKRSSATTKSRLEKRRRKSAGQELKNSFKFQVLSFKTTDRLSHTLLHETRNLKPETARHKRSDETRHFRAHDKFFLGKWTRDALAVCRAHSRRAGTGPSFSSATSPIMRRTATCMSFPA